MKNDNGLQLLFKIVIITLILGLITVLTHTPELIILVAISGIIAISGMFTIPNDPPCVGLVIKAGARTNEVYHEGLGFLLLRGILNDIFLIDVSHKRVQLDEQILITRLDSVTTKIKASYSYYPDPDNLITFLDNGGEPGVKRMMNAMFLEKLRIWSRDPLKGPKTWEELHASSDKAKRNILSLIVDEEVSENDIRKHKSWKVSEIGIILELFTLRSTQSFGKNFQASLAINLEKSKAASSTYELMTDISKAKIIHDKLAENGEKVGLDKVLNKTMDWKIQREANAQISLSAIVRVIANAIKK